MSKPVSSIVFRISAMALVLLLGLALSAWAQPLSSVGKRNYNRAVRAEHANDMAAAREYWAAADQAWAAWLDEHRDDAIPSADNMAMAGIAFYKNGRAEAAVEVLDLVREQEPYRFEPWVFTGLAWASLGQTDQALAAWQGAPPIAVDKKLAPVLVEQRQALAQGRTGLAEAALAIEDKCRDLTKEIMVTDDPPDPLFLYKDDKFDWRGGNWGQ